jgi:head-tail adaptor
MIKKSHLIKKLKDRIELFERKIIKNDQGQEIETWHKNCEVWAEIKAFRKFFPNINESIFEPKTKIFYKIAMRKLDISNAGHAELRRLTYKYKILDIIDSWIESVDGSWLEALAVEVVGD